MFKIIWTDLKAMIKRPFLFFVMFLGISVGAFSLLVYYVKGASSKYLADNTPLRARTMEFETDGNMYSADYKSLIELIESGKIPQINYVSVISYTNSDYDVIGLYYNKDDTGIVSGELVNKNHLGKQVATVSADLYDNEDLALGQDIKITGQNYEIVGLFSPGQYEPMIYDITRMSDGQAHVAGQDHAHHERLNSVRSRKAIIIPLDNALSDFNYKSECIHFSFSEDIPEKDRAQIEETILYSHCGAMQVRDISKYIKVVETNYLAELIVYCIAIFAGLINIITLFSYFLRENKKKYHTYKMFGASPEKLYFICITELAVFTLLGFTVGVSGAIPFISRSELFAYHIPYGILEIIVIYLLFLAVEIIVSLKAIREIAFPEKLKKERCFNGSKVYANKFLTVLGYRYSGKNILHIASVSFLSLAISFVLTFGFSYVFDSAKFSRYINKYFSIETVAFSPALMTDIRYNEVESKRDPSADKYFMEMEETFRNLKGVIGVGKVSDWFWTESYENVTFENETDKFIFLKTCNKDYVEFSPMPLAEGSWNKLLEYNKANESVPIPCVVSEYHKDRFPLGSKFMLEVEYLVYNADGTTDTARLAKEFEVVGLAQKDALRLIYTYSDDGFPDISKFLTDYRVPSEINESGYAIQQELIVPEFNIEGSNAVSSLGGSMPSYVLYSDKITEDTVADWRNEIVKYGTVYSYDDLCNKYTENYKSGGGSTYFVHAAIAGALLIIGIGGYSLMFFASMKRNYGVYYICGMPWSKAVSSIVTGNAFDILFPGVIGSIAGVFVVQRVREFSLDSMLLASLSGLTVVFAVFLLTSAIVGTLLIKYSPNKLIHDNL